MTDTASITAASSQSVFLEIDRLSDETMTNRYVPPAGWHDADLANGSAGVIIWLVELYIYNKDDHILHRVRQELDYLIKSVEEYPLSFGLYSGLAGVSWAINYAIEALGPSLLDVDSSFTKELDEILFKAVMRVPLWDYDLINGLVGIGAWALELKDRDLGDKVFRLVMQRLGYMCEKRSNGIAWLTSPNFVPEQMRLLYPSGYYNLGLAHGVPGIISLIGKSCLRGFANDSDLVMLDAAVNFLMGCRNSSGKLCFPFYEGYEGESRLAWCYGDLGVAVALAQAALGLSDKCLLDEAVSIAICALQSDASTSGVMDGVICHGALGVAHIADEFYKLTSSAHFLDCRDTWIGAAARLTDRTPAGLLYPAYMGERRGYEQHRGYLTGISGVGLVLLSLQRCTSGHWNMPLLTRLES